MFACVVYCTILLILLVYLSDLLIGLEIDNVLYYFFSVMAQQVTDCVTRRREKHMGKHSRCLQF